jgi:isopenicillin N synthase-like dioxygenase
LELLNDHLVLPEGTLQNMHRIKGRSGDQIRFIKAPPQPKDDRRTALGEHTDFGSVTVLFNRLGGLQVLPPGRDAQWCYVKPLDGHAIINLGDAMVKFTNGLLRSNIHRVSAPPGDQADYTRYSLVYFNRPENEVMLKRLDGSDIIPPLADDEVEEEISSKDWIIRRALAHRVNLNKNAAADWDKIKGTEERSQRAYL